MYYIQEIGLVLSVFGGDIEIKDKGFKINDSE